MAIILIPPNPSPTQVRSGNGLMFCTLDVLKPDKFSINDLGAAEESFILPMPKELSDISVQNWEQKELGTSLIDRILVGGSAGAGAGSDGNPGAAVKNTIISGLQSVGIAEGSLEAIRRSQGIAVNKANTLLFQAPSLRTFQLSWDLIPTNARLGQLQQDFVKYLRRQMHPRLDSNAAFITPYLFAFSCKVANKVIVRTLPAAITNLTWNVFGSNIPAFHSDGVPVHSVVTVELQELVPNTQQSIDMLYKEGA